MKIWLSAALVVAMLAGMAGAEDENHPRISRHRPKSPGPQGTTATAPAAVPSPPPAVSTPAGPSTGNASPAGVPPGAPSGGQIYVWKERGIMHAVSNPSDVPPRFSKRAESLDPNPQIIRMLPEGPFPGVARKTRKHRRNAPPRAVKSAEKD
jgi:hypothetical protein